MEDLMRIVSLSLAMFVGCYVAGTLPLSITLSEEKFHMVTLLGAGLLVGTALAVIIPEGVHALYDKVHDHHEHGHHHVEHAGQTVMPTAAVASLHETTHGAGFLPDLSSMPVVEPHAFIGISLCLGFVFMLLVDHCFGGHSHSPDVENGTKQRGNNVTATLGLVVHAAADGIAMGAAVVSSKPDIEFIIFVAIMLHKAPAAFGLTSFLLHENMQRNRIRRHLIIFSMAAPVLAMLTYTCLSQSEKEYFTTVNGTGIAMLFSAGTFLYVATVHVLPETTNMNQSSTTNTAEDTTHTHTKRTHVVLLVIGILCPLLLTATHHH